MLNKTGMVLGCLAGLALSGCVAVVAPTLPGTSPEPVVLQSDPKAIKGTYATPINALRAQRGLSPVSRNSALVRAAEAHAKDMAANDFFSHRGSNGSSVRQRIRAHGYAPCITAENIGRGNSTLNATLDQWMNSGGHRRNVMKPSVTEFGMARGPGNLWVLVLSRPGC